jgi:hypothetical protein
MHGNRRYDSRREGKKSLRLKGLDRVALRRLK